MFLLEYMDFDWKNWKTYASLFIILFSIYSFIKTVLIIIRGLSYNPNDISNFQNLNVVIGPIFRYGFFDLWFIFYVIIAILFLVLAFSLWKQKKLGVLLGGLPFLWLLYTNINPHFIYYVQMLIHIPDRFFSEIGGFISLLLYTLFYIASIIYLIYNYKSLKNPVENISSKPSKIQ